MIRSINALFVFLLLASCDIGPTSTPADPNQSFTLAKLSSTAPGTVFSAKLSGHDSKGVNYTGSISVANRAQTMRNDVSLTPQEFIINISGGGTSMTYAGTNYIDTNGNLISSVMHTTGQTCAPVAPYAMPETVKIGDFGFLPEITCSDNTTQVRNWRVEDARNGNINVIYNVTVKNQLNTIVSVADVTLTINGSSNIVSCKIVITQPSIKYKITLTVNKPLRG